MFVVMGMAEYVFPVQSTPMSPHLSLKVEPTQCSGVHTVGRKPGHSMPFYVLHVHQKEHECMA